MLAWAPKKDRSYAGLCEHPDCRSPRSHMPRRATGTLLIDGYPLGAYCPTHADEMRGIWYGALEERTA